MAEATIPRNCGRLTSRGRAAAESAGIERGKELLTGQGADDINLQLGRFAFRQPVQRAGNGARDAGAHEHIIHVGQHRAVERRQGGQLDFFEKINADQSVVAFLGQKYFHEICRHRQFHQGRAGAERRHGGGFERRRRRFSSGNEILRQHARGDGRDGELVQGAAQVAIGITELQVAGQDDGESRPGNDAKLAQPRNGARQFPAGNGHAHSALNNFWLRHNS